MGDQGFEITEGTGTSIHSWGRSVASTTRLDQFYVHGEQPYATFTAQAVVRANIANSHLMFLQGDGTNYLRLRRLTIRQANIASAASTMDIRVYRTSTAGSSGTTVNARSFDEADGAHGGVIQTLPTSKGTEGNQLLSMRLGVASANPLTNYVEWRESDRAKPIIFGNGTANGIAIKNINALALELDVEAEFSLVNYL